MKRYPLPALIGVVALLVGGCSITGTWKTVEVTPADALEHAPFSMVTFAQDGQYSATRQHGNEVRTTTGSYAWGWGKLTITPQDGEAREYPGHYNTITRRLILSYQTDDQKVTATLEKQEDLPR